MTTFRRCLDENDFADTAAIFTGDGRRCLGRAQQARLRKVGCVGESRRLADDDPYPRTAVAPAGQLFDLAVVEEDRRARAVLYEDLREIASFAKSLM